MTKRSNDEYVNSSYTSLYLLFTILCSVGISFAFGDASVSIFIAVLGYAVLSYFTWDLIRQLFYPGQAVFLYLVTFYILPVLMNFFLTNSVGTLAIVIHISANALALLFETLYEGFIKKHLPTKVLKRLLMVDAKVDRSIAPLSVNHLQLTEFRGIIIALGLVALYFSAILLLLHK